MPRSKQCTARSETMARLRKYFTLFAFLIVLISCGKNLQADKSSYYLLEDSTLTLSADEAWENFHHNKFKKQSRQSFNPGFTTSYFWLVAETNGTENKPSLLEIGTSQINEVLFYEIVNDTPILRYSTGDHKPFSSRPLSSINFTFPLSKGVRHYLVRIDKKNESLQLTFLTRRVHEYFSESSESSLIIGIMTGAIVLMLI